MARAKRIRVGLVVLLALAIPPAAHAQTDGVLALGAGIVARVSGRGGSDRDLAFLWRIGRGDEGWGIKYGFNWYSTELDRSLAGRNEAFGKLKVRPILIGYGYTRVIGSTKISANLKGGYAFSSFSLRPTFHEAYRAALGAQATQAKAGNTFVLKPEVTAWIDINRKIGLNITAGYMIARPELALTSSLGVDRRRVRADMFMLKVGAVYSVF